jgi:hypothetical protein
MSKKLWAAGVTFVLGVLSVGCASGGVGDPCAPEDEYQQYFSGYSIGEVNIESRSFQCETRLCLVNHFQGRVTCPYGQDLDDMGNLIVAGGIAATENQYCHIPGTNDQRIKVTVKKQLTLRRPNDAVYCSCRCNGPDANARYCKCPTGFACVELLSSIDRLGSKELSGSYCIKEGTAYTKTGAQSTPVGHECQVGKDPPECGAADGSE